MITGTSSGIGEATASHLSRAGFKVYGSRRCALRLKKEYEMLALEVTSDVSVQAAIASVIGQEGRMDLLLNNAGFGVAPAGAEVLAQTVLRAALVRKPKLRYTAGASAKRLRMLPRSHRQAW